MLNDKKIIAFVAITDAARSKAFYTSKLGLKVISEDNFAVAVDCNGIMLRLALVPKHEAAQYSVLSWEVDDIHDAIKGLTKNEITFERYNFFQQDDSGVWTAPGGTKVAWFKDPDGNILSLTQF